MELYRFTGSGRGRGHRFARPPEIFRALLRIGKAEIKRSRNQTAKRESNKRGEGRNSMASTSPWRVSAEDAAGIDASAEEALDWFRKMRLIRRFEERAEEAYGKGKIGGFLHLYIGEEAIAVGAMAALLPEDDVITHYRDHGYVLARGIDPKRVMAELYGKATGLSKGKGGSMHMADVGRHLWGGYAIVGGHIPLAAGLALANQYRKRPQVVACFFGEGATNTGVVLLRPQPGRGVETAADRDRRKQPVRDGDRHRTRVRGLRCLQEGVRLRHPGGADRRERRPRRAGRRAPDGRPGPGRRRSATDRGDDVPLPRPLDGGSATLSHQGGSRRGEDARSDPALGARRPGKRPGDGRRTAKDRGRGRCRGGGGGPVRREQPRARPGRLGSDVLVPE